MRMLARALVVGTVLLGSTVAHAQEGVAQAIGHGKVDWSSKTVTATGSGAPSLKAKNVAAARLGAERAAKLDAFRNILEAIKGVRVTGSQSAGAQMDATPEVKTRVEGVINNFKVLDTKYYSDGGVDVIVQVPLSGVLTELLVPEAGSKSTAGAADDATGTTGIIINAKGLGAAPALAPRLLDEAGKELFSASLVSREAATRDGVVGYAPTVEVAMKDPRAGDKPLLVKAARPSEPGGSDLVLLADDAAKITKMTKVIAAGRVIIVAD